MEGEKIYDEFYNKVNMTPSEIESWLDTDKSKSVGVKDESGNIKGRESGKKIIDIKRTSKDDLSKSQYEHMQKVNSYIARHSAQRPSGEIKESDWRYSLKNWGHDPLKEN